MARIGDLGSRSDLEALRRSGRGKIVILVGTFGAALAAATYAFVKPTGSGNTEDPAKVLVVTRGETIGYSIALRDMGMDAAEGTFAAWVQKASEEVPDLEESGASAILRLADRFGYGYVAFEYPRDVDFAAVDFDGAMPELGEHVRFAVVSAGDLAFPHRMTVNPEPSTVVRDPTLVLLQALFEQEVLGAVRGPPESLTVETIKLKDRVSKALDRLGRVPEAEKIAGQVIREVEQRLIGDERARPAPALLHGPLESVESVPLPTGEILSITKRFDIVSSDGVRIDLDLIDRHEILVHPPGSIVSESRVPCVALAGGTLEGTDSPRWEAAVDGGSLLLHTLTDGWVLWRLKEGEGACGFEHRGSIPHPGRGIESFGAVLGDRVARRGKLDKFGVVSLVTAGSDEQQLLGMINGVTLANPSWVGDDHLVARGTPDDGGPDALYFMAVTQPLAVLRLDATAFEDADRIGDVAVRPGDHSALVVSAGSHPHKLYVLELPAMMSEMFEAPPLDTVAKSARVQGQPTVYSLDTNVFRTRALTHEGEARHPAISPDGIWVAFTLGKTSFDRPDAADDDEVAVTRLDGRAGIRLLSRNALPDRRPRFTADSSRVVFATRVELPRTRWVVTASRIASLTGE